MDLLSSVLSIALIVAPFIIQIIRRRWAAQEEQEKPTSEKMGEALAGRDTARISDLLDDMLDAD